MKIPIKQPKFWVAMLLACMVFAGVVFFIQKSKNGQSNYPQTQLTKEDQKKLIAEVSKIIDLPQSEEPTIAVVADPERLKTQAFFSRAKVGDRVLIYTNAKKAILYRPGERRIIEVGPINITNTTTPAPVSATTTPDVSPTPKTYAVVVLNGTNVIGLTKRFDAQIAAKAPELVIKDRDNAKRPDYTTSLLVDVGGTHTELATKLAKTLGLDLKPLPAGEATPASDFLIILGSDKK